MQRKLSVSISLDSDQVEQLDRISGSTKIPRSALVREAIGSVIEKYKEQLTLPLEVDKSKAPKRKRA